MTTSLWPYAITDEWKAAGVNFQDFFTNASMSARNGLKTVGSPVVSDGLHLDGSTQYGYYNTPRFHAAPGFTIELKFVPNFEFGDSVSRYIFDGTPNTQLTLVKTNTNFLLFYVGGTNVFFSAAFAPYWRANQENNLIISATSGDTTAYLNGIKVIDSDASVFGLYKISRFTIGAAFNGSQKSQMTIKSFRFFMNSFTDADCEKLYDGRLLSELDPEKATLFAGLRSSYTNGAGEKVTPVLINGETQEMLFGSDGKTAGEYPTEVLPRGWQLNGTAFGNAGDRDEFSFVGDKPFSVFCFYQPRSPFVFSAMVSKYTNAGSGEWMLYHTNTGLVRLFQSDQSAGTSIFQTVTAPLVSGLAETWLGVSDGSGTTAGQLIYRNGNIAPSTPTGAYGGMKNSTVPLLLGNYGGAIAQAGTREYLVQVVDTNLSKAQARILDARARRLKNV